VELVRWEGLFHEMFNEPERERVFARMEAWIGGRLAARGAAPPAR
jgi:alpha-beta hydrolase superfamily lysophospholipase